MNVAHVALGTSLGVGNPLCSGLETKAFTFNRSSDSLSGAFVVAGGWLGGEGVFQNTAHEWSWGPINCGSLDPPFPII